ncbi:c-type heme family protein [Allorhodopirellula solitaria]|uniref:Tll0287-like domain-containing protein n=1 Tax=Allorhodopirellula solitaria TaxID=2527987 RepID=A0A5C5XQK4_9BACT|nr:DUF3365 domain-containing protein [Allorhodopirellula solitaria]TWT64761.1 hypothetical protein CA85_35460 [Allorhodopirellula solitaria]
MKRRTLLTLLILGVAFCFLKLPAQESPSTGEANPPRGTKSPPRDKKSPPSGAKNPLGDTKNPLGSEGESFSQPTTVAQARSRAQLLHESIHGTLQVVHRDFFDDDNPIAIPSNSLEDVFAALEDSYQLELSWLIVETDTLNIDHEPQDEFENAAVKALRSGEPRHEAIENGRYRFAGPIRLASQCLKCHVKNRLSTEDRTAGLLISMPLDQDR